MLTIRIFDSHGRLVRRIGDVPDDAGPGAILDHVVQTEIENPRQAYSVRVENEAGKGYWILFGEQCTEEIEHPRCRERKGEKT